MNEEKYEFLIITNGKNAFREWGKKEEQYNKEKKITKLKNKLESELPKQEVVRIKKDKI